MVAVLPVYWTQSAALNMVSCSTLHIYYLSAFGIFVKPSGVSLIPCAPMGCYMGVYVFHPDQLHVPL